MRQTTWMVVAVVCVVLAGCASPLPIESPREEFVAVSMPVAVIHEAAVAPAIDEAMVVRVCDGDTIVVEFDENGDGTREQVKVRFIAVSTPEIGKPFAELATQYLEDLLLGRTVILEREGANEQPARGYYPRRLLRHIFVDDPVTGERIHVNAAIVAAGYATSTPHGNVRYKATFERLEQEARTAQRGRWAPKPRKVAVRRYRRTVFCCIECNRSL